MALGAARRGSGGGSVRRGLRGGSANPTAQTPEHRAQGHSPGSGECSELLKGCSAHGGTRILLVSISWSSACIFINSLFLLVQ
ncbi:unnamed protein product [Nyctereutes procyonoides]|uniref:(raccoon dog) hypothetical protein n=1 Tax=Nyctereutes procyonoides TaxID=34880 RepID=A0A811ZXU3_NYCPR|nr:unnamed protein product [Nyctereutes procyonoides]